MKTLIIVSGGDAPGINPLLYHLCSGAGTADRMFIGAAGGFRALLDEQFVPVTAAAVSPWIGMGGSLLPSSRDPVLSEPANRAAVRAICDRHGIDSIVLFGGNGSLRYLPPILAEMGIPWVGIPTTIDNDVPGTQRTLGFDSACQYACQAIDGIRATGHALAGRFFTVETLGGHCGNLALEVAAGAGADAVMVPEYSPDEAQIASRLAAAIARKGHALLVYTEFVPDKEALLARLADGAGARLRETRLGHAQRGGTPTHSDRRLARDWARLVISALQEGRPGSITVWRGGAAALHDGLLPDEPAPSPDRALYAQLNGIDS